MTADNPTRCIDPVMKCCHYCRWGMVRYPEWVETSADLEGCSFECGCLFGYDEGRPEDEPTEEEIKDYNERYFPSLK